MIAGDPSGRKYVVSGRNNSRYNKRLGYRIVFGSDVLYVNNVNGYEEIGPLPGNGNRSADSEIGRAERGKTAGRSSGDSVRPIQIPTAELQMAVSPDSKPSSKSRVGSPPSLLSVAELHSGSSG